MVCQFGPIQFWPIHFWPIVFFCVVVVGFGVGKCSVVSLLVCCVLLLWVWWVCSGPLSRRPHQTGPFTRQPQNSKRAHLSARRFKHHQKSTKDPKRKKNEKTVAGEGKSEKFWAPTLRGPTLRGPHFIWVWLPTLGRATTPKILAKKIDWPKNWIGQLDWPKLVKSRWPKQDWPKSVSFFFFLPPFRPNKIGQMWHWPHLVFKNWPNLAT